MTFKSISRSLIILAGALTFAAMNSAQPIPFAPAEYVPDELIIQFNAQVTDAQIRDAFQRGALGLIRHVRTAAMQDRQQVGLTHVSTGLPVPAAVALIKNLAGVEFAEPNWIATPDYQSNDPLYLDGSLWGVFSDDLPSPIGPGATFNQFASQAEKAWDAGFIGSPTVFVGMIDSGFQYDHPDLAANVWVNPGEIPGNGFDDDGDGYVDDVRGWNSMSDNGVTYDLADLANEVHGTLTTGIVGAAGGNGVGMAGIAWNVRLISGKFMPRGAYLDAIEALDYMTTLKTKKGLNIVALNNSWSGTGFSQALLDAYGRAAQAGIISVCSAGNVTNNNDVVPRYPANFDTTAIAGYDAIVTVAAIDRYGNKGDFSDYGANSVDLGAPGVDMTSTSPGSSYTGGKQGTSYAAPHVTGAIALFAAANPGTAPAQIRQTLLTYGVRALPALQGITVTGGTLDIAAFLSAPGTGLAAPAGPGNLSVAAASDGSVNITWIDQSTDELGFAIERSTDGQNFILADTVGANFTAYKDRTARPNTTYTYRLSAYNAGGASPAIIGMTTVLNVTIPAAPANATATALARGGGISVAWTDHSNNESGFQVERRTAAATKGGTAGPWQTLATLAQNAVNYSDTAVVSNTSYTYRIRAYNVVGVSAYSAEVTVKAR